MITNLISSLIMLSFASQQQEKSHFVLKSSVSYFKDLPKDFYGKWAIKSTRQTTTNPELFGEESIDIWVFSKDGQNITLSNPMTGATASILVEEVSDKHAVFSRQKRKPEALETEIVELTADGDRIYGEDKQIIKYISQNKIFKTDVVKYKVVGKKFPPQFQD